VIAHDLAGTRVEEGGDVARVVGRTAADVATAETQSCNVILWRKNQLFVMICTVFFLRCRAFENWITKLL